MDANGIIGREYEQKLILERCKSNKAELIAIYGRRRVGKTFLVRKMFNDQFAFSFIGMYEVSRAVQLEQFRMALAQYAKQTVPKLKTWFEAFAALREYLSGLSQHNRLFCSLMSCLGWIRPKAILSQLSVISGIHGLLHSSTETDRLWLFHHVDVG